MCRLKKRKEGSTAQKEKQKDGGIEKEVKDGGVHRKKGCTEALKTTE